MIAVRTAGEMRKALRKMQGNGQPPQGKWPISPGSNYFCG